MTELKNIVRKALDFVREIYSDQNIEGLALEELRKSDDEKYWLITVGFNSLGGYRQVSGRSGMLFSQEVHLERIPRDLKVVKVDVQTGEVWPEILDRDLSKAG